MMAWLHRRYIVAPMLLLVAFLSPCCLGWSPVSLRVALIKRRRFLHVPTHIRYKEREEDDTSKFIDDINLQIDTGALRVDTDFMKPFEDQLMQWMGTLPGVTRSQPVWVGSNILHLSPSETLQECLSSMQVRADLFPLQQVRKKHLFDWDWKYAMVKSLTQQPDWTQRSWKLGASNTHPLRLQVVVIPPHTSLQAHVHPAVELDIPILGTLYEEKSPEPSQRQPQPLVESRVDPDLIDRAPEHSLGTPLSDFSPTPTPQELQIIAVDISQRVSSVHRLSDFERDWQTHAIQPGQCLLNPVGSVHRSFTREEPCLLFCLGPNVHARFIESMDG
jgi:hypothetical protein